MGILVAFDGLLPDISFAEEVLALIWPLMHETNISLLSFDMPHDLAGGRALFYGVNHFLSVHWSSITVLHV